MRKREARRAQPVHAFFSSPAVQRIAQQRMAQCRRVHTNLVRPARMKKKANEAGVYAVSVSYTHLTLPTTERV